MGLTVGLLVGGCSVVKASCSVAGGRSLDLEVVTSGGELTRNELLTTPQGQTLEAFFVGGEGEVEGEEYRKADAFTIVSNGYVIGFEHGVSASYFTLDGGQVSGWGGCQPVLVRGDQVARRWHPAIPPNPDDTSIPILVEGGGCVEDGATRVMTEIVEIQVQDEDAVVVTAWTRDRRPFTGCAGVGVELGAEAVLTAPLGDRELLDGGVFPAIHVNP